MSRRILGVAATALLGPALTAILYTLGWIALGEIHLSHQDHLVINSLPFWIPYVILHSGVIMIAPASLLAAAMAVAGLKARAVYAMAGALLGPAVELSYVAVLGRWDDLILRTLSDPKTVALGLVSTVVAGIVCGDLYWRIAVSPARSEVEQDPAGRATR